MSWYEWYLVMAGINVAMVVVHKVIGSLGSQGAAYHSVDQCPACLGQHSGPDCEGQRHAGDQLVYPIAECEAHDQGDQSPDWICV